MSAIEEPRDPLRNSPSNSARPDRVRVAAIDLALLAGKAGDGSRARLKVVRIEFIGVTGAAGDELDDRQNGAIKEILLWLHQQEHTPKP